MKMAWLVCNSFHVDTLMGVLKQCDIDYFTRLDNAKGKGHGTEPHLGAGAYGSTNTVLMIAFEEDAPLEALIAGIREANKGIPRSADRIRLFQQPLDRIV
jgi:hypothetical protein